MLILVQFTLEVVHTVPSDGLDGGGKGRNTVLELYETETDVQMLRARVWNWNYQNW